MSLNINEQEMSLNFNELNMDEFQSNFAQYAGPTFNHPIYHEEYLQSDDDQTHSSDNKYSFTRKDRESSPDHDRESSPDHTRNDRESSPDCARNDRESSPDHARNYRKRSPNRARKYHPQKMRICAFFNTGRGCKNGTNCTFVHDEHRISFKQVRQCPTPNCQNTCLGKRCSDCHLRGA